VLITYAKTKNSKADKPNAKKNNVCVQLDAEEVGN
jgi:hypothetical protein